MRVALVSSLLLVSAPLAIGACDAASSSSEGEGEAAAEGEGESGVGGCHVVTAGRWIGDGGCFGMEMSADVAYDDANCAATFSNWNMQMSVPGGFDVDGTALQFVGSGWSDCTGVLADDGASLTGTCGTGGNACTFTMSAQ